MKTIRAPLIMENGKEKLTLKDVSARKEAAKRFLANRRYMTTGNPRRGGIASVYRAFDTQEERYVAVKVFRALSGTDDVVEESFRRETQALSDLKHPNIVQILDSGFDDDTCEHFIAMEWIDEDLETLCAKKQFGSWAEFFGSIGRQVLEALSFAHIHATVHRDIKPSNILVTAQGVAKVCDFGISKIRNFLEPGVTLAQYASMPYAPPEQDDGAYSYSRDVFGFAALAVVTLSKGTFQHHRELFQALETLQLEDPVRRLLRRCLTLDDPSDRPQNAAVLLSEFERLQPRPPIVKQGTVLITLTKKVKDIVVHDLGLKTDAAIQRFVESDLDDAVCEHDKGEPKSHPDGTPPLGRAIRIYGSRYAYVGLMALPDGRRLSLVSALDLSTSEMERSRDRGYKAAFRFGLEGAKSEESGTNIAILNDSLLQFSADQKVELLQQREQAIYKTWLDLLSAKTELERARKKKLKYETFEMSGTAIRFKLAAGSNPSLMDEQDVSIELTSGEAFLGAVVSVGDDSVTVQPSERNRADSGALPDAGVLGIDTTKADAALDKQKAAVDAVRYGRSVNPTLGDYIVVPSAVPVPTTSEVEFIQGKIDDDKKEAVQMAMSRPSLMLVQGPPGTGKTTFITELVLQTLRDHAEARILLTSQTHVALDNSLERIAKESGGAIDAVRIGHEDDDRIPASTKTLLVDSKLPLMRRAALSKGKDFIEKWATEHGVPINNTRMAMALERRAGLRERLEYVEGQIHELSPLLVEDKRKTMEAEERAEIDEQMEGLLKEQDALHRDLKESVGEMRKHENDKETVDHFATCSAAELRTWADSYSQDTLEGKQLSKLLAAHGEWEARFGRSREFRAALIASSQVVAGTCLGVMGIPGRNEITYDLCIVDEASIATPTEVLVPMSRARRTVLVGDNKQLSPFQDPELKASGLLQKFFLTPEDQRATLFNHLNDGLPPELCKTLTTQHRMLPAIGNLISACFYNGELQSVERQPAAHLKGVMAKPVVWLSTSRRHNKSSKPIGTSHVNDLEVQLIIKLLAKTDFTMRHGKAKGRKISVAVLTGYGEQKKRLRAAIDTKSHEWVSFSDIYVNVVDAFQGREAEMLVFSVTRSDVKGLGFLREMERINVALSRGKELLAIVGDHGFCQAAEEQSNPLKDVLDYIRRNPQDCALEEVPE